MDNIMDEEESVVAKLSDENNLLKEHIKELENEIERIYHVMISLKSIAAEEIENLEDIEEI